MLGLFRKIDRLSHWKKKTGKYLFYAVGEIVLVVLGILIALTINNWNEERKDKERSQYYLQSLSQEFATNQVRIEHAIAFHEAQSRYCRWAFDLLEGNTPAVSLDTLHVGLMQISWAWDPNFRKDVWTELLSTGQVGLIKNDSLREMITRFFIDLNQAVQLEEEWSNYNLNFRDASGELFPWKLRLATGLVTGQYSMTGKIDERLLAVSEIQNSLKKINKIEVLLTDIVIVRKVGLFVLTNLKRKNEEIHQLILKELH